MFKTFGFLFVGILVVQVAFSQENYIPGYVIKNGADTLFGFVDFRDWGYNPRRIMFRSTIESTPVSFTPIDIVEFKVGNEIYKRGIVNTEISSIQTNQLRESRQLDIKVDTAFLQTLFDGDKSLYYYKNLEGRENFYISKENGFELLLYKRYFIQQEGRRAVTENRTYLGQLSSYLKDCESIDTKIRNTTYSKKSLTELFQHYYKCSSTNITFQRAVERIRTEVGLVAGISYTSLKFRSDDFDYLVGADYDPSLNFTAGISLDFTLPRNHGKWSIYNEVLFTTYEAKGSYLRYVSENNYSVTTTEIGYSYLKVNNMIRFKYPVRHFSLFLNGGISSGFSLRETNFRSVYTKFHTTERTVDDVALSDTRKYEQGFIVGAGSKYRRYSFEIRYERGNGMSEYTALVSSTKRYSFLLGYRF